MIETVKLKLEKRIECKMENKTQHKLSRDVAIKFVMRGENERGSRERERNKWGIISHHIIVDTIVNAF